MLDLTFLVLSLLVAKVIPKDVSFVGFKNVATMPYPVSDMTATLFSGSTYSDNKGDRVYLAGGCVGEQLCPMNLGYCYCTAVTDKIMYFTPSNRKYTVLSAPMPRARSRHMAAAQGQYLYLFGGRDVNDTVISVVDRYDTFADTWDTPLPPLPLPLSDGGVFTSVFNETFVYLVGGYDQDYNSQKSVWVVDTSAKNYSSSLVPAMQVDRGDVAIVQVSDRNVYVLGGFNSGIGFNSPLGEVEVYDPLTNTWGGEVGAGVLNMNLSRGDLAAGTLKGWVFAVGGETKENNISVPVQIVERYVPDEGVWYDEEEIPHDLFRFVGASHGNSIYLFGGQGVFDETTRTYPLKNSTVQYIPASTSSKPPLDAGGISGIVVGAALLTLSIGICIWMGVRHNLRYFALQDDDENGGIVDGLEAAVGRNAVSKADGVKETARSEEDEVEMIFSSSVSRGVGNQARPPQSSSLNEQLQERDDFDQITV